MKPYEQGALDGLCAVYGIVNAVRIISGIDEEKSKVLFKRIIMYLEKKNDLPTILTSGIGLTTIGSIFRDVTGRSIKNRSMPFKQSPDTPLDVFWEEMMRFLAEGEKRVVFIGLGGVYDHWSIVETITERQIRLFDSFKLKRLNRSRCATIRCTALRPHLLCPTHTYFLS